MPKIIGKKGQHQIGQVTSRERGELVTQVGIISASGSALPPVWIFPRRRFDGNRMLQGVPDVGPLALVHSSGWMTSENFLKVLEFFVANTRCSKQNKVLLIMDNHESHLSIPGLDFCKDNGIIVLTLPPHTSNKLQPLDRTVFGPFKTFFNQAADAWMLAHPGRTLTIYDLPALCYVSWDRAATPTNIKSGFKSTGISPFDRNIFTEDDFMCSSVTDRTLVTDETPDEQKKESPDEQEPIPTSSNNTSGNFLTPEQVRPYPKAEQRKNTRKNIRKGKCMIATDTPEKTEIQMRKMKKSNSEQEVNSTDKTKAVKKKVFQEESSEEEEEIELNDSSDDEIFGNEEDASGDVRKLEKGSFVIAQVKGKASVRNYAAEILEPDFGGYNVKFLKRQIPSNRFTYYEENAAFIAFKEIVVILPKPLEDRRERFKNMIYFNADLAEYSLQ